MKNQNKYDDLLQNEEELFRRFMEKGTSRAEEERGLTHKDEYTYDSYNEEDVSNICEELADCSDVISSAKDIVPDMSEFFSDDNKNLGFFKKTKLFFSVITKKENVKKLTCLIIPGFLILFLIINIIVPSDKMSETENRSLAQFPKVSTERIFNGNFMNDFESYISDQFVLRDSFVSAKRCYELTMGKEENHGILVCDDGYLIESGANLKNDNLKSNIDGINALTGVDRYNVRVAVVPTAYEVLKDKLPDYAYVNSYGKLQKELKKEVKNATVTDTLPVFEANKNKYIYYRTDHHQTALGSYYLYSALGETLGYEPYGLNDFAIEKVSDTFLGTTWSNSGFADTKNDAVYKYTLTKEFKYSVEFPDENKKMDSLYNSKMLKKKDKYSFYLDGNHGLTVISSDCNTGKKLAIIKDSYAHSLAPFLANHYNSIHMIDLRYFSGDIFEYLYANNLKDCLVLYNHNTFMTDNNLSKISDFAKISPYTSVPDINYGVVPETQEADVSYFDDAVFVGDSLTIGIQNFSGFNSTFLCMGGLNTKNLETGALPNGKTTMQAIKDKSQLGKLYIMLGTNEIAFNEPEDFFERYSVFIDNVRKKFPDVIVYIQSIMPVTKETSETTGIKNDEIVSYNERLLEMAIEKQCYYIDLHSYFKGEDGALPDNIGSDGIHLGPEKYRELASYLKSHAVPAAGVVKIDSSSKTGFAKGGSEDTQAIAEKILKSVKFKDELFKVSDTLIVSNYKADTKKLHSASLYLGGGVTAEEVAVFEAVSEKEAKNIEALAKERIERKKKDYENYIPEEMPKLNAPYIVRKGKVVIVCIADSANKKELEKLIK